MALALFGVAALILGLFNLPETNRFRGTPLRQQIGTYKSLTRLPLFWLYAGISGFASAGFFSFVGGGPAVSAIYLDLSPSTYGLYFMFTALGYSIGNFLTGRYSERHGLERMMIEGAFITIAGPLITIVLFSLNALIIHTALLITPAAHPKCHLYKEGVKLPVHTPLLSFACRRGRPRKRTLLTLHSSPPRLGLIR